MKFNQILYFVTTVKYNNITKASKKLFVSQPAISLAIKELEEEFKTTLFIRNNNQLTLTDDGKYFYELAKSFLVQTEKIERDMRMHVKKSETLLIGIPPMLGTLLLPRIVEGFAKVHPYAQFEVKEYGSAANQESTRTGELDIAITVIYQGRKKPDLNYLKIGKTALRLAVNSKSPLAKLTTIDFSNIAETPLILMDDGTLQAEIVNHEFEKRDIRPNVKIRSNQIYTIHDLLARNDYAAFVFDGIFDNEEDIITIPFKDDITFDIVLCWKIDAILNKLTNEFIEYFKKNN